ncbi:MAG: hypothetical protein OEX23_14300 [Betaproteobacteria bacterium]|nr:hypothetical protein [Betaproteobacteria bacterium]
MFITYLAAVVMGLAGCATPSPQKPPPACGVPEALREGWSASFRAGCTDRNGRLAGGSQVMHLVSHRGSLYAANGFWQDRRNVWYGGIDQYSGWGQVLRLSGPDEAWVVDLELGPRHLRTELLKSVTFTVDADGRPLPQPRTLLVAAAYDGGGSAVHMFVRNDDDGTWTRSGVIAGNTGVKGEDNSVRSAVVYQDRVTGEQRLHLSVGVLGVFTAGYDPLSPGQLRWSTQPEAGTQTETRILSMVEANGSLYLSGGTRVLRRVDGPSPHYVLVADMAGERDPSTGRTTFQAIGGIRGLSAIEGPVAGRQSLIFLWHPGRQSPGCVMRLDPQPDGSYARYREICLADLVSRHLGGAPIPFVLGAYNTFTPLQDPDSQGLHHVIGLEAFIASRPSGQSFHRLIAQGQETPNGGFYGGALYAVRDPTGHWRVGEVNGKYRADERGLVSIYTVALAPFARDGRSMVYVGGYDPNGKPSSDTAWVYGASLANLLSSAKQD